MFKKWKRLRGTEEDVIQIQPKKLPFSPEVDEPIIFGNDASNEEEKPSPEDLQRFLEPCSKDQLISFLADAAVGDPDLLSHLRSVADQDIAHRKIFIRSFGWDVTTESLLDTFRPYGHIVDCKVVIDKATGRNKGFGFVVFSTRKGALKALKSPEKKIGTRIASCQLASTGVTARVSADVAQRRVYVSNVHTDASPDKLKSFFSAFGEIESGPSGFDAMTGKFNGFAIFVYKTRNGATRALQEPYKLFEGHQLHCTLAFERAIRAQKAKFPPPVAAPQSLPIPNQQPTLTAVAAAPNLTMVNKNPPYNMLYTQNPILTNAALNPSPIVALNQAAYPAYNPSSSLIAPQGHGYGGVGYGGVGYGAVGVGLGGSTMFGTYRAQETARLPYGGSQLGQFSSVPPVAGFFAGFPQ